MSLTTEEIQSVRDAKYPWASLAKLIHGLPSHSDAPDNFVRELCDLALQASAPIAWIVAIEEHGQMVAYGPQYRSLKSAEEDVRLPKMRGQKAQVWACYQVNDPTSFDPDK